MGSSVYGSTLGPRNNITPCCTAPFGFQYWLWGDATLGYHLVNILMHAMAAVMVGVDSTATIYPWAFPSSGYLRPAPCPSGIGGVDHGT